MVLEMMERSETVNGWLGSPPFVSWAMIDRAQSIFFLPSSPDSWGSGSADVGSGNPEV